MTKKMKYNEMISYEWAVAIYQGKSLDSLSPINGISKPVLTGKDVTDIESTFAADPFMYFHKNKWHLFFEALNKATSLGEIGYASSPNLVDWKYEEIVLRESFHLSYPFVFTWENEIYMIPETRQAKEVRLYKADQFPYKWSQDKVLLEGNYADATLFHHNDKFWLFALNGTEDLHLYWADSLNSEWQLHPKSPLITGDKRLSRPAGKIQIENNRIYRFAQDGVPLYGSRVRMIEITKLSTSEYEEEEVESSPILMGSRKKDWNSIAMHHIDAHQQTDGSWVACVDGAQPRFNLPKDSKVKCSSHSK